MIRIIALLVFINMVVAFAEQQSVFNPDIGVVGELNVLKNENTGAYVPAIGEVEMNFSAPVDPLGSAVFTIAVAQEGTEIEEAYLKLPEMPNGLIGRFGRVKVNFNHLNMLHAHEFPFLGQAKYLEDFFGEAGVIKDGFEFGSILPTFLSYSDLTLGYFGGNSDNTFSGDYPLASVKWNNFLEIGDNSGVELGASLLDGTSSQNAHVTVKGINFRVKQQIGIHDSLIWDNELLYSNSDQDSSTKIGAFHYLGYNMNKQIQFGIGMNRSDQPDGSTYKDLFVAVQYKVTEFQMYKLQYTQEDNGNNSIGLNLTYFIGPHPVHEF